MPFVIPWYAWVIGTGAVGVSVYKGVDNVTGKPFEIIKENALPLAAITAGTFIALKYISKKA